MEGVGGVPGAEHRDVAAHPRGVGGGAGELRVRPPGQHRILVQRQRQVAHLGAERRADRGGRPGTRWLGEPSPLPRTSTAGGCSPEKWNGQPSRWGSGDSIRVPAAAYWSSSATRRPSRRELSDPCHSRPSNTSASPSRISGWASSVWGSSPRASPSTVSSSASSRPIRRSASACWTGWPASWERLTNLSDDSRLVFSRPTQTLAARWPGRAVSRSQGQAWRSPGRRATSVAPHSTTSSPGSASRATTAAWPGRRRGDRLWRWPCPPRAAGRSARGRRAAGTRPASEAGRDRRSPRDEPTRRGRPTRPATARGRRGPPRAGPTRRSPSRGPGWSGPRARSHRGWSRWWPRAGWWRR